VLDTHARKDAIALEVEERTGVILLPDALMSVGMMASELLVNAIRHAFPDGREGRIRILLDSREGRQAIIVEDDGVGLPAFVDAKRSLGLRLIRSFAARLDATIDFERPAEGGTRVVLTLPARPS
jgi:two-component sensor histidine kinase